MMRPGPRLSRLRQRARNAATLARAIARGRGAEVNGQGDAASRRGLEHFPAPPFVHGQARYELPAWMDDRQPWVGSLRDLYALPISWPTSLSPQAGLLLHSLVLNTSPRVIVETGTFAGVSTHWMAAAMQALGGDRVLHSFDTFDEAAWRQRWQERGAAAPPASQRALIEQSLHRSGLQKCVLLHAGDSAALLQSLGPQLAPTGVQLAFLDGDHGQAGVLRDLHAVEPVLDRGGYLVLHDVYPDQCSHRGPRFVLDNLGSVAQGRYECCEVYTAPWNFGMAILRRIG